MNRIANIEAFLAVVREGSFSAAADKLGRSTAAVSRQVRSLEDRIGSRLLERSTRSLHVTETGLEFFERAGAALNELDAAEAAVTGLRELARGTLRVNAAESFGERHLASIVPEFLDAFPDVRLSLTLTDRFVDVLADGYDVVIRISDIADSMLTTRPLAPCRRVLCATPAYLNRHGTPATPSDLEDHLCIGYSISTTWRFRGGVRHSGSVQHTPLETCNSEIMRSAVIAGKGIALLPTFLIADDLRSRTLTTVLDRFLDADTMIHALYPDRRLPAKTRVFVDFLAQKITTPPPWDVGLDRIGSASR